jgi:hypothetical protein
MTSDYSFLFFRTQSFAAEWPKVYHALAFKVLKSFSSDSCIQCLEDNLQNRTPQGMLAQTL